MEPGIRAARDQQARERMETAVRGLAAHFGVAVDLPDVRAYDPQTRAMLRQEQLAAALTDIALAAEQSRTKGKAAA